MTSLLGPLFPFLMIAVLFYLLMIRPERRKRAELAEMLQNLKKNDRVVTIGGIYGTVVATSRKIRMKSPSRSTKTRTPSCECSAAPLLAFITVDESIARHRAFDHSPRTHTRTIHVSGN